MTELVDPGEIEDLVGVKRHAVQHYGHAVAAQNKIYILHSAHCVATQEDLRKCPYSVALDQGAPLNQWYFHLNTPVRLAIDVDGYLVPYRGVMDRTLWPSYPPNNPDPEDM